VTDSIEVGGSFFRVAGLQAVMVWQAGWHMLRCDRHFRAARVLCERVARGGRECERAHVVSVGSNF